MTTKDSSMRTVKALLKLVDEHNLDYLEVDGIKIQKSKHYAMAPIDSPSALSPTAPKKSNGGIPTSLDDIEISPEEKWFYNLNNA